MTARRAMPPPAALAEMSRLYEKAMTLVERKAGVGPGELTAEQYGRIAEQCYDAVRRAACAKIAVPPKKGGPKT